MTWVQYLEPTWDPKTICDDSSHRGWCPLLSSVGTKHARDADIHAVWNLNRSGLPQTHAFECMLSGTIRICSLTGGNVSLWRRALRSPMLKLHPVWNLVLS